MDAVNAQLILVRRRASDGKAFFKYGSSGDLNTVAAEVRSGVRGMGRGVGGEGGRRGLEEVVIGGRGGGSDALMM